MNHDLSYSVCAEAREAVVQAEANKMREEFKARQCERACSQLSLTFGRMLKRGIVCAVKEWKLGQLAAVKAKLETEAAGMDQALQEATAAQEAFKKEAAAREKALGEAAALQERLKNEAAERERGLLQQGARAETISKEAAARHLCRIFAHMSGQSMMFYWNQWKVCVAISQAKAVDPVATVMGLMSRVSPPASPAPAPDLLSKSHLVGEGPRKTEETVDSSDAVTSVINVLQRVAPSQKNCHPEEESPKVQSLTSDDESTDSEEIQTIQPCEVVQDSVTTVLNVMQRVAPSETGADAAPAPAEEREKDSSALVTSFNEEDSIEDPVTSVINVLHHVAPVSPREPPVEIKIPVQELLEMLHQMAPLPTHATSKVLSQVSLERKTDKVGVTSNASRPKHSDAGDEEGDVDGPWFQDKDGMWFRQGKEQHLLQRPGDARWFSQPPPEQLHAGVRTGWFQRVRDGSWFKGETSDSQGEQTQLEDFVVQEEDVVTPDPSLTDNETALYAIYKDLDQKIRNTLPRLRN